MSIRTNHQLATGRSRVTRAIKSGFAAAALTSTVVTMGAIVGAASASAATAQPAAPTLTGVTWHQLTPIDGWHSAQAHYGTGNPSWTVQKGVVYLSGSVLQTSGTNEEIAVLPAAARPSHALYMTVYTLDDTQGFITIYPNGQVYASSSPYSNAQGYTSLAGISYPAPSMATHKLALKNGWVSSESEYNTGDPSYSVSNGVAYLSGSLHQPSGTNQVFAVLPVAARPAHPLYLSVYTYSGTKGILEIFPNGTIAAYDGGSQQYTSLAGISFPLSATAHALTLENGWQSGQSQYNTGDPSYSVSNGVVYLSGSLVQPSGSSEIFGALPAAERPKHDLYIQIMVHTPNEVAQAGTLEIDPDGTMWAYSDWGNATQVFTSLAGISFPLGS